MHPGARSAIPAPFAALATTPDADPKQGRPGAGACYTIRGRLLPPDTPQPSALPDSNHDRDGGSVLPAHLPW